MADIHSLRAETSDPTTSPRRLAEIVVAEPSLGALVAAHPAAYDGLLDWLERFGDQEARNAAHARRGLATQAAPVAPAPAASVPVVAAEVTTYGNPLTEPKKKPTRAKNIGTGLLFIVLGGLGFLAFLGIGSAVHLWIVPLAAGAIVLALVGLGAIAFSGSD